MNVRTYHDNVGSKIHRVTHTNRWNQRHDMEA